MQQKIFFSVLLALNSSLLAMQPESMNLLDLIDTDLTDIEKFSVISRAIQEGADINCSDINGNTPLHYLMTICNEWSRGPIQELLQRGANINAQNCAGQAPLHFLRYWGRAEDWIQAGARPDIKDVEGKTVFEAIFPCLMGHDNAFSYMTLFADWPVDSFDSEGFTILHRLCMSHSNWRHAHYFMERGADPNAFTRNAQRATALHLAARYRRRIQEEPLFSSLLQFGADSALRDGNGDTVFDIQMQHIRHDTLLSAALRGSIGEESGGGALFLLKSCGNKLHDAKKEAVFVAARKAHPEFLELLLAHGAQVSKSAHRANPLHELAQEQRENYSHPVRDAKRVQITKIIRALLHAGANINAQTHYLSETPLYQAVKKRDWLVAPLLLEFGADPNIPTPEGLTPLQITDNSEIAHALVNHGARVDRKINATDFLWDRLHSLPNAAFYSAFAHAIGNNDHRTIKCLLDQGGWLGNMILSVLIPLEKPSIGIRTLKILLTRPLPGPIYIDRAIVELKKQWLNFLCSFSKFKDSTGIQLPRDVRCLIARMVLPSAATCIELVPTKNLKHFAWMYGKKTLLAAAVTRHVAHIRKHLEEALASSDKVEHVYLFPESEQLVDPKNIDTVLKPLIEEKYRKLFQ